MVPACPICKVPMSRREVRAAPQMDNLVNIYRSMESATGINLFTSQFITEPNVLTDDCTINTNNSLFSDATKKRQRSKYDSTISDATESAIIFQNSSPKQLLKGVIPAKKRVQVPMLSSGGEQVAGQQNMTSQRKSLNYRRRKIGGNVVSGKENNCLEKDNAEAGSIANSQMLSSKMKEEFEGSGWQLKKCTTYTKTIASQVNNTNDENLVENETDSVKTNACLSKGSRSDIDCRQTCGKETQIIQSSPSYRPTLSSLKELDVNCFDKSYREAVSDGYDSDEIELTQPSPPSQPEDSPAKEQVAADYGPTESRRISDKSISLDVSMDPERAGLYAKTSCLSDKMEKNIQSNGTLCAFCNNSGDFKLAGPLIHYKDGVPLKGGVDGLNDRDIIPVHKLCAEWAPDVYFVNDVAKNLSSEVARGKKMKCSSCRLRGAALGCCLKQCRKSYHYPCARAGSCRWDEDKFVILCPEHANCEFPHKQGEKNTAAKINMTKNTVKNHGAGAHPAAASCSDSQKWQHSASSKWVLCGSGLSSAEKEEVCCFANLTGARVSKEWSLAVTHLIAGTDDQGVARRTVKFLMATLGGKWILRTDWMTACMAAGKPVREDDHEITLDIHGTVGGPKRGRSLIAAKEPKIFEGMDFYLVGAFDPTCKASLQMLVLAAGGALLHRKPLRAEEAVQTGKRRAILVYYRDVLPMAGEGEDGMEGIWRRQAEAAELAHAGGATAVPHSWVLDSVAACELQPVERVDREPLFS